MSTLTLYILTGILSVIIAFLLANLARRSSQTKIESESIKKRADGPGSSDPSLKKVIADEISEFVHSEPIANEVSEAVANVFNKELEKRVAVHSQELTQKYEKIIVEKAKNEEVAWQKYSKTLVDKRQTEAVIRSIAEGLVVVDAHGKVILMNPAAEKLLGSKSKDKAGKSILENLKEEQLVSFSKPSVDGKGREIELASQQDETKKVLRASSAVIEDENGQTVGMVSVLSDITKQKEIDQLKSNFVANVSHELRTPLVAMQKSIALILEKTTGPLTSEQEQFLTITERNLKRLSFLINDLLDLSKLEAGKLELKREVISIEDVISDSVATLSTWAKTKSLTLEKKIEKGLPQVNIDPNRIIQVLNNLIGNAIKFSPGNSTITVGASLVQGEMQVSVKDQGIGIAPENLNKVFDKFYQVGERVATDIGGTGIGLSISKEIVQLHAGKIWVESDKGQGAIFNFSLPLN